MYLAAAFRPHALCTWTMSVTTREAAPLPVCPSGLTGLCLYRMQTSNSPTKTKAITVRYCLYLYIPISMRAWLCVYTWGLRLVYCGTLCPGNQGQREHLSLVRMLSLHGDHGTQLGQRKHSSGHELISHIWIVISTERHYIDHKKKKSWASCNQDWLLSHKWWFKLVDLKILSGMPPLHLVVCTHTCSLRITSLKTLKSNAADLYIIMHNWAFRNKVFSLTGYSVKLTD